MPEVREGRAEQQLALHFHALQPELIGQQPSEIIDHVRGADWDQGPDGDDGRALDQGKPMRVNLLFPIDMMDPRALAYYEAFLHVRWKPIFEGREWI